MREGHIDLQMHTDMGGFTYVYALYFPLLKLMCTHAYKCRYGHTLNKHNCSHTDTQKHMQLHNL